MNCHYHPDLPSTAFCQFCGKPLCKDCVRNVGGAVYCETCLAERLRAAGAPAAAFSTGTPHPLLAGLLGFIPGVGAMYNGQYAKAIAHVLIFAVLASLSDHSSGIFGILVAAWVFYQVFDAYQTAIARRDGLPLPNPFGLNDIAQRLGIHTHPGTAMPGSGMPGSGMPPIPPVPPVPPAGSNWEPTPAAGFVPPAGASYTNQPPYSSAAGYGSGQPHTPGQQPYASGQSYGQPYVPVSPFDPYAGRRDLPVGAIILIGLGILFLFGSLGLLRGIWIGHAWPLLIIGLGIWIIIRRTRSLPPVMPPADGSGHPGAAHPGVNPPVHSDPGGGVR